MISLFSIAMGCPVVWLECHSWSYSPPGIHLLPKLSTMPGGANAGGTRDATSIPGVGTIPWRRKWQLTPVFLIWKIPWTEAPGGLQSTGSQSWTRQGHSRGTSTLSGISPESPQDGDPEVTIEFLAPGVYRISFLIPSYASDPPNTALLDNSPLKGTGIPTCSQVKKTFHFLVSFCLMAVRHVRSSLPAQGLSRPPLH